VVFFALNYNIFTLYCIVNFTAFWNLCRKVSEFRQLDFSDSVGKAVKEELSDNKSAWEVLFSCVVVAAGRVHSRGHIHHAEAEGEED